MHAIRTCVRSKRKPLASENVFLELFGNDDARDAKVAYATAVNGPSTPHPATRPLAPRTSRAWLIPRFHTGTRELPQRQMGYLVRDRDAPAPAVGQRGRKWPLGGTGSTTITGLPGMPESHIPAFRTKILAYRPARKPSDSQFLRR